MSCSDHRPSAFLGSNCCVRLKSDVRYYMNRETSHAILSSLVIATPHKHIFIVCSPFVRIKLSALPSSSSHVCKLQGRALQLYSSVDYLTKIPFTIVCVSCKVQARPAQSPHSRLHLLRQPTRKLKAVGMHDSARANAMDTSRVTPCVWLGSA